MLPKVLPIQKALKDGIPMAIKLGEFRKSTYKAGGKVIEVPNSTFAHKPKFFLSVSA